MAVTRAVLKLGGGVIADPVVLGTVLEDAVALHRGGWKLVLCHGGGPQAGALQRQLGQAPNVVGGRRVTDPAALRVVKQVLAGEVSVDVVAAAVAAGLRAVGLSGVSDGFISATRCPPSVVPGCGDTPIDYGMVGEILTVDTRLIEHLFAGGFTPVINPLGAAADDPPQVYNINADTVASAVAAALRVDHLFLMTSVPGVLADVDDPTSRFATLRASQARAAIRDGVVVGGMIPKVSDALDNLERGIRAVHILGADQGALAAAAREPGSVGTVVLPDA